MNKNILISSFSPTWTSSIEYYINPKFWILDICQEALAPQEYERECNYAHRQNQNRQQQKIISMLVLDRVIGHENETIFGLVVGTTFLLITNT